MKIKIIAHTHWDREWYFSHYKSRVYSFLIFDEIINYLENNENFKYFLLDGQTSILEEYLQFHPYMKNRLERLVREKRIFTGPWYSQTDTLVISAENIIRNLLYGTSYAKNLGHSMQIGYLPDSFGMSWQMPQIYQGFNLDYTMFRRGIADYMSKDREFYWESPDGSRVFCHNIYHYGSMAYPPESYEELEEYMDEMIDLLGESSKTGIIVLFNGEDQKPIRKNLPEIIKKMNDIGKKKGISVELANPEEVMEELVSSDYDFDHYSGEMTMGQHSRTHKSIFSTRYDLKQKNNYMENYLSNIFEPLLSLAHVLGLNYEQDAVKYIWKKMLDNSAHDSIGMCNSDITNSFISNRFDDAFEFSHKLSELSLRQIANRIDGSNIFKFQVFNFLPYKRDVKINMDIYLPSENVRLLRHTGEEVDYIINSIEDVTEKIFKLSKRETGVAGNINADWLKLDKIYLANITADIKDIVALGYETIYVEEVGDRKNQPSINRISKLENIESKTFKICVKEGKILVHDKRNDKDYLIYLEDDGDEGDSYDYSQPSYDWKINDFDDASYEYSENKFYSFLDMEFSMNIPENLKQRKDKIAGKTMTGRIHLSLDKKTNLIKIKLKILNPSIEHRLRLVVKSDIKSDKSIADQHFGTIERPTVLNYPNWKEDGFNEKPRTIEPMMSFCALANENQSLQLLTDDVREYQVIGEKLDSLAMTIFRSTPYLGRKNLNDRPGRESGNTSETFDTRYVDKIIEAEYAIAIYNKRASDFEMAKVSKELFTPPIYYQAAEFKNNTENLVVNNVEKRDFPRNLSLLHIDGDVILSSFKKSEDGEDLILRLFNPSRKEIEDDPTINLSDKAIKSVTAEVKLDEKTPINLKGFKPCQARTFLLSK